MSQQAPATYRFGEFTLNESTRKLQRGESVVAVNPKAFDVLCCLVERAGQVVSRDELLRFVWPDAVVEEANLSQQIFGLRRALGDCSGYIATLPGRGYQFVEPVTEEQPPAEASLVEVPVTESGSSPIARGVWLAIGVIAILAAAGGWFGYRHFHSGPSVPYCSVLLADFTNATGNPSLDATLRQAMEIEIEQSPFMSVLGRGEVAEVLRQMSKDPAAPLTPEIAREVCERSNHQVLISGGVARLGGKYVLTVQASECVGGRLLAGDSRTAGSEEGLLAAVNDTARLIRKRLGESAASLQRYSVPIERATTPSLEALKAYSLAVQLEDHGHDMATMLQMYRRAVEIDPGFAMGYSALANVYYSNDEGAQAAEAARKAYELSAQGTERERLLIQFHYHADTEQDLEKALAVAQAWAATYPHDWRPLILIADMYNDMGQYAPALAAGRRALALAPDHAAIYNILARSERRSGNFAETRRLAKEATAHGAMAASLHATLFQTAVAEHDAATLKSETEWALRDGSWFPLAVLADAAATEGRLADARRLFATAREKALANSLHETSDIILVDEAVILFALGEPAEAQRVLAPVQQVGWSDRADLAVLQARLGNPAAANAFLKGAQSKPEATLVQRYDVPRVKAALALAAGHPDEAVAALEPSRPYELQDFRALALRAEANERAGKYTEAVAAYQRILSNTGVDPVTVALPLARLGMARCLKKLHRDAESEAQYAALREQWKNADQRLAVVQQARDGRSELAP